jgi:transglutaminase-like putative cysteine protease
VVDEDAGSATTYLLHQRFRYEYPTPIRQLEHRLMVIPPHLHGDQRRVVCRLQVHGADVNRVAWLDGFGNLVVEFRARIVPEIIEFESWVAVERAVEAHAVPTALDPAFEDPRLLEPSRLTQPDDALFEAARSLGADGAPPLERAERVNHWVAEVMRYTPGATTVKTTAAQALALGRGVCQDYAHVMLALTRLCGVPARYVSGHLVGEGGSHAWVEVGVPDPLRAGRTMAVAFDPTHDRRAGAGYVTVAVGRDYADVAPTSGAFQAACSGRLFCRKRLQVAPPSEPPLRAAG